MTLSDQKLGLWLEFFELWLFGVPLGFLWHSRSLSLKFKLKLNLYFYLIFLPQYKILWQLDRIWNRYRILFRNVHFTSSFLLFFHFFKSLIQFKYWFNSHKFSFWQFRHHPNSVESRYLLLGSLEQFRI